MPPRKLAGRQESTCVHCLRSESVEGLIYCFLILEYFSLKLNRWPQFRDLLVTEILVEMRSTVPEKDGCRPPKILYSQIALKLV